MAFELRWFVLQAPLLKNKTVIFFSKTTLWGNGDHSSPLPSCEDTRSKTATKKTTLKSCMSDTASCGGSESGAASTNRSERAGWHGTSISLGCSRCRPVRKMKTCLGFIRRCGDPVEGRGGQVELMDYALGRGGAVDSATPPAVSLTTASPRPLRAKKKGSGSRHLHAQVSAGFTINKINSRGNYIIFEAAV